MEIGRGSYWWRRGGGGAPSWPGAKRSKPKELHGALIVSPAQHATQGSRSAEYTASDGE